MNLSRNGRRRSEPDRGDSGPPRLLVLLAVGALGVSAFVTQLTLMRELMSVFAGNELVLGIVLGSWMLLTGLGAAAGRSAGRLERPLGALVVCQVLVALLPPASVFALRALRNVVFLPGVEVGPVETVLACLALLAPYCLVTGYLLTLACRVLAEHDEPSSIGRVYFLDNVGDVLGGLLFTFVLVHRFDHFAILYLPAAMNLVLAALVALGARRRALAVGVGVVAVGFAALTVGFDLERDSLRRQYPGQEIVFSGNSPYGSLVVTRASGQLNFIAGGVTLFTTENVEQVEETVHYAMAQRPDARRVLLLSGGVSGTADEALKYPVEQVDYVELDPLILEVARRLLPERLDAPRLRVVEADGRQHVRRAEAVYDVVIVDAPDPSTSQINRFYTREFFRDARRAMRPGGVLAFSLGRYENYLSPELAAMLATAWRTLREVFGEVLVLPGGRVFFLASDGPLSADVVAGIERAGVSTRLVGPDYLRGTLTPDRLAAVARARNDAAPANTDFGPTLYYEHLRWWISQFRVRFGLMEGLLLVPLVVYLVRLRPVPLAILTTGFAASTLSVVLMLAVQVLYGCVYQQVGLLVTAFMLGLGLGAAWMNRRLARWEGRHLARLEVALALLAAAVPLGLLALGRAGAPPAGQAVIAAMTLAVGVLVGMEFPLAGKAVMERDARRAEPESAGTGGVPRVAGAAARLYTADYLGAAVGALIVSTWLIPLLGMMTVCLLAAGLNLASAAVLRLR